MILWEMLTQQSLINAFEDIPSYEEEIDGSILDDYIPANSLIALNDLQSRGLLVDGKRLSEISDPSLIEGGEGRRFIMLYAVKCGWRPTIPDDCPSDEYIQLMKDCWHSDP